MSFAFNPHQGLVIVQAQIGGPSGSGILLLALDTGATSTLMSQSRLMQLGYDPAVVPGRVQISTASGLEFVPSLSVAKIAALGVEHINFSVLSHFLPASAGVDGLLGLDYFRGRSLTLDFRAGQITVP